MERIKILVGFKLNTEIDEVKQKILNENLESQVVAGIKYYGRWLFNSTIEELSEWPLELKLTGTYVDTITQVIWKSKIGIRQEELKFYIFKVKE